jgi:hypothetical protein
MIKEFNYALRRNAFGKASNSSMCKGAAPLHVVRRLFKPGGLGSKVMGRLGSGKVAGAAKRLDVGIARSIPKLEQQAKVLIGQRLGRKGRKIARFAKPWAAMGAAEVGYSSLTGGGDGEGVDKATINNMQKSLNNIRANLLDMIDCKRSFATRFVNKGVAKGRK